MGYGQTYTRKAVIGICGMLVFGTGTMVTSKIMLDLQACWPENDFIKDVTRGEGCSVKHHFEKPWWQTAVMFVGMSMCTLIFIGIRAWKSSQYRKRTMGAAPLEDGTSTSDRDVATPNPADEDEALAKLRAYAVFKFNDRWIDYLKVAIPAVFDMIATALMTYGLVYIDVSVMQMLRGVMTVWSTLFAMCFFRRHVHAYNWIAVGCVIVACVLVGTACIMGSQGSTTARSAADQLLGCTLVIISQLVQAAQIVVESFLLDRVELPALIIVGFEGIWGFIVTFFVMLAAQFIPGGDDGSMENTVTSFYMMGQNTGIIVASVVYWICITFLNWSGMTVTRELGPVVRTIWEAVRTAAIWLVDLLIFYAVVPNSVYGESWNGWSMLQLCGFCLLVAGSMVNNAMIKFPKLYYPPGFLVGAKMPNMDEVRQWVIQNINEEAKSEPTSISE